MPYGRAVTSFLAALSASLDGGQFVAFRLPPWRSALFDTFLPDDSSFDRLDRIDKQSRGVLPSGVPSRGGARFGGKPPPFSRIADQLA